MIRARLCAHQRAKVTAVSTLKSTAPTFRMILSQSATFSSSSSSTPSSNLDDSSVDAYYSQKLIPGIDYKLVYDRPNPIPGPYPPSEDYLASIQDYTLPASDPASPLYPFRYILSHGSTKSRHAPKSTSTTTTHKDSTSTSQQTRPMRIAHITDLHYLDTSPISWQQLLNKRGLGYINLYYRGRAKEFSASARAAIIRKVIEEKPDMVIISGDLTSTARESEFIMAREGLKEILDNFPTFVIPGNHDYYAADAVKSNHMIRYFGPWMNLTPEEYRGVDLYKPPTEVTESIRQVLNPAQTYASSKDSTEGSLGQLHPPFQKLPCLSLEDIVVVGLDPTEPRLIRSNGSYKPLELENLWAFLNPVQSIHGLDPRGRELPEPTFPALDSVYHNPLRDKFVILATHYPLIDRSGRDYQSMHKIHGALNNEHLIQLLDRAQVKPNLLLHGHDHLSFTVPFFSRPCQVFCNAFDAALVQKKDAEDRASIVADLQQHPQVTLTEFKKYGEIGKRGKLVEFDKNRFPISSSLRYLEKNRKHKKLNFTAPRTRTFENRGIFRRFSEYSVPFTICNPGSSGLGWANPKHEKDWARRSTLLIYNVAKRDEKTLKSPVESNVTAEKYSIMVNRAKFLYEGKSNFDLHVQRFEVTKGNDDVVEVPASPRFSHPMYDYKDLIQNSKVAPLPAEQMYMPTPSPLTQGLYSAANSIRSHVPEPVQKAMDRVMFAINQLRIFW